MEYGFVKKIDSERLLLCFLGWASGPETLKNFDMDGFDIIAVYDYRKTECPDALKKSVDSYAQLWIIGWSFGVYMAESIAEDLKKSVMSLAVNGTSFPCSADYGIPPKSLALTVRSIAKTGMDKFYARMCGGVEDDIIPSNRSIEELADELTVLAGEFEKKREAVSIWSDALIGTGDVIFPFANMKRFWEEQSPSTDVIVADIPHFPFTGAGMEIIKNIFAWKEKNL